MFQIFDISASGRSLRSSWHDYLCRMLAIWSHYETADCVVCAGVFSELLFALDLLINAEFAVVSVFTWF